jgi:mannose-1-phosphate guanylyltransferase
VGRQRRGAPRLVRTRCHGLTGPVVIDAIVLVGGQGTRLRPLTVTTPKPMLAVAGVPFLTHQLARLAAAGVDHVVLATSYKPSGFVDHFGDGAALGLAVDYVTEDVPLGTGGGIRNVAELLRAEADDPVVVLNGDVLSGHDLAAQLEAHRRAAAEVTLHLTVVDDPRAFGCVPTASDDRVTAFLEKTPDPVTNQINAGCYVFRRSVIDGIPAGRPVSVERETFPELLAAGARVQGYVEPAYWLDLGTPADYVRGSCDIVLGHVGSTALPGPGGDCLVLDGAEVAAGAVMTGGTTVGAGASVAGDTTIDGSVVLDGATIGAGCRITASVVGRDARIGDGTVLDEAVVADGATIGAGNELRAGIRVWPGTVIPDGSVRFSTDAVG